MYQNKELENKMNSFKEINDENIFAMEGKTFLKLLIDTENGIIPTNITHNLIKDCKIYSRMTPEMKKILVSNLRSIFEITVGMCGDGANDCAALKEANVGLSLSDAEASIAAPFTTKVFEIKTFIRLLSEGRCALVTSFQCFKWMAMYSLIQFISVSTLYVFGSALTDNQFLYIDLFSILPLV